MPEDHKPTSESDHDWMVEALEEEELSEHGLSPRTAGRRGDARRRPSAAR